MVDKLIPFQYRRGRILDIGCGEYPHFLINTEFNEKYGIDRVFNKEVFDNKGKEKIFIKRCNIEQDGLNIFQDGHFDVVTMSAVIEHLRPEGLPHIIKEARRVLKPGGILILTTPAPWGDFILQMLARLKLIDSELLKEHKMLYTSKRISSILSDSGFSEGHIKYGNFEFFMNIWSVAVKK